MTGSWILLVAVAAAAVVFLLAFAGCGEHLTLLDNPDPAPPIPGPVPPVPPVPARPTYQEVILDPTQQGLISYWRLDDDPAVGFAKDIEPTAPRNDGRYSPTGVTFEQGALADREPTDTAAAFDGQKKGFVEMDPEPNLAMSFSIEAWIKPDVPTPPVDQTVQVVFSAMDVVGNAFHGFALALVREGNPEPDLFPSFRASVGTGQPDELQAAVVELVGGPGDAWRHVVVTYDGGAGPQGKTLKLSVSTNAGREVATTANVNYNKNDSQPMRIAAGRTLQDPGPSNFFTGRIDEVALYNFPLEDGRISDHFVASRP